MVCRTNGLSQLLGLTLTVVALLFAGDSLPLAWGLSEGQEIAKAHADIKANRHQLAHKRLQQLAKSGSAKAQTFLGLLHEEGVGVERDFEKAAQWYEKAAANGLGEAQNKLGHLYLQGKGVEKDPAKAARWLEKAAAQDIEEAQMSLGKLYSQGQGVVRDPERARLWLRRAVAKDVDGAREELEKIPGVTKFEQKVHVTGQNYGQGMNNLEQSWQGYADIVQSVRDAAGGASQYSQ